jgi:hypothetical protein
MDAKECWVIGQYKKACFEGLLRTVTKDSVLRHHHRIAHAINKTKTKIDQLFVVVCILLQILESNLICNVSNLDSR